ncbi:MAG: nucleotidyltransferase domain-containing protein [Campylobacterota bacterium]|nr:nucleotidyltransferase domain-containing protein [Campylobacterota bacterium]
MSIILESNIVEQIKSILKKELKIKQIILFGSRAKGDAKNGSDIDIAVVGDNIGFRDLCRFNTKLDELELAYQIDIVAYNSLENKELIEHINRTGITL